MDRGTERLWKAMGKADDIGRRGESIAFTRISKICRPDSDLPYFVPRLLGEKARTFDLLVESMEEDKTPHIFLVQVKATRKDFTKGKPIPRLRVEVSEEDVCRMVACPVPTYLVGVHEPTDRAFLVAIHGEMSHGISSMTTAHELTSETLGKLREEVREFWRDRDMTQAVSHFLN